MSLQAALSGSSLFGQLPDELLVRLAPWCEQRLVRAGDVLLTEGESASRLYVLVSGQAVICKNVGEADALVARLGPGAHLGEIDLLDAETATATVIMETDGEVVQLDAARFRQMLVRDRQLFSHVARVLFADLAERVRRTNERVRATIAWGLDAAGDAA